MITSPGVSSTLPPPSGARDEVRLPSADLVAVVVRRGGDGVVCVSYRLAGRVRLGSEFAFETRLRPMDGASAGPGVDQQRYEVQLTSDGKVQVSRPQAEPRYPVRARLARLGDTLNVEMQTLLGSKDTFAWRAEISSLPRFPLGDTYIDAVPDGAAWVPFRARS